jgi:predicted O-linked N-acetylglucosamine transferase (SPINDLY family)
MQYRFSDAIVDPPGISDGCYSESLVRLDRFYAAFRPDPQARPVGSAPAASGQGVTFASLNTFAKITRPMLDLWANILNEIPNARLLLQAAGLEGPEFADYIHHVFALKGIARERLMLRGWTGMEEFIRVGELADIALDPFPFNGGVTTCHALWMGLPVVTMCGESAASRVGASILTRIGLSDLVVSNEDAYRTAAVTLANNPQRLAALRASLRERMVSGGILDGNDLAAQAASAFRAMWRNWCAK